MTAQHLQALVRSLRELWPLPCLQPCRMARYCTSAWYFLSRHQPERQRQWQGSSCMTAGGKSPMHHMDYETEQLSVPGGFLFRRCRL